MANNIDQMSEKTCTTFRFVSGEILALDDDQIEKIPYLSAMISSADRFDSARDEDGHYKLDPNIDYQHFSFALRSLSFKSLRQLFTDLPEEENVIPIIALLDFLGLIPSSLPTFEEIDSIFFSAVVYSPHCERYLRIVNPRTMQDMAVRFSIALIKEEYDFGQWEVMDQIYWFVMFILSVEKWFQPRLRHHVYTTAKSCFAVFKPSLLEPLKELSPTSRRQNNIIRKNLRIWFDQNIDLFDEMFSHYSTSIYYINLDDDLYGGLFRRLFRCHCWVKISTSHFLNSIHIDEQYSPFTEKSTKQDFLELIVEHVLEIMYARLQAAICQNARVELDQRRNLCKTAQRGTNLEILPHTFEQEILPEKIDDIFRSQLVQEEIDALILQHVCLLKPVIERERGELSQLIRKYENENDEALYLLFSFSFSFYPLTYKSAQEKLLSYEILLDKLYRNSHIIMEEIRDRVLVRLTAVALKQFNQWYNTQQKIDELELELKQNKKGKSLYRLIHDIKSEIRQGQPTDDSSHINKKKSKHPQYQLTVSKPLLNRHFKHSKR